MSTDTRRLIAIVLIALVIRLLLAAALGDGFHFGDETLYVDSARRLWTAEGFGPSFKRVPGYPVLLAALGGPSPSVVWLRMVQATLAAGGAALTYVLANQLVGRTAALGAAAVYALDPLMAVSAGLLYPEATAALLLAATVLAALHAARHNSSAWAVLAGALLGALAQFRQVSLALLPVIVAWIGLATLPPQARRARNAAAVVLGCLLMLAPWTYRNYQIQGRIVPVSLAGTGSGRGWPEAVDARPGATGGSRDAVDVRGVVAMFATQASSDPWRLAGRIAQEFAHFWELFPQRLQTDDPERREALHQANPRLPTTAVAPQGLRNVVAAVASGTEFLLAMLGLVVLWRRRRRAAVLLATLILAFALGQSLFAGKMRYRIPVLPLVFVLAGAGIEVVWVAAAKRSEAAPEPRP